MMPGRPAAGHPRGGPPRRPDHPSVPPLPPRLSRRPPGTRLRRSGHPGHSPHARTRQHLLLDAVRCLRRVTISFLLWRDGGRDVCLFPSSTPTCVKPPLPSRMSERSYHVFFFFYPRLARLRITSLRRLVFLRSTGIFSPRTMVPAVLVEHDDSCGTMLAVEPRLHPNPRSYYYFFFCEFYAWPHFRTTRVVASRRRSRLLG